MTVPINYGKKLAILFDGPIYNVSNDDLRSVYLISAMNHPTFQEYIYPTLITKGATSREVYLHFEDINNIKHPVGLCFHNTKMGSPNLGLPNTIIEIFPRGLKPVPGEESGIILSRASLSGALFTKREISAQNNISAEIYPMLTSTELSGILFKIKYNSGQHVEDISPILTMAAISGVRTDAGGIPI